MVFQYNDKISRIFKNILHSKSYAQPLHCRYDMTEEIDLTKLPREQQMSKYYRIWFNPRDGKIYEDNGHLAGKEQLTLHQEQKFVITTPTNGEEEDYVLILAVSKEECELLQREYSEEQRTAVKKVFQW